MNPEALLSLVRARAGTCRAAAFSQRGTMRLASGKGWLPFAAEQTMQADPPGFAWRAKVRLLPLVTARVTDSLQPGGGALEARVFGLRFMRATGADVDRGQLMRWMAELPWCPGGFDTPGIEWRSEGDGLLTARLRDAEVTFQVGPDGQIISATALRPRQSGKASVLTRWTGVYDGELQVGPVRVPARASVTWHLPEGDFTYWRGEITDWRPA